MERAERRSSIATIEACSLLCDCTFRPDGMVTYCSGFGDGMLRLAGSSVQAGRHCQTALSGKDAKRRVRRPAGGVKCDRHTSKTTHFTKLPSMYTGRNDKVWAVGESVTFREHACHPTPFPVTADPDRKRERSQRPTSSD